MPNHEQWERLRQARAEELGIPEDHLPRRGRHGNHVRSSAHPRWNGGVATSSHGYLKVQVGASHPLADPNGYAYLHHLVVCSALGRLLSPAETVDHDDENKLNNRLANLIVRTQSEHAKRHNAARERDVLGRFAS